METDFEKSNIALLGSDLEHEIREKRAQLEPEWHKIKQEPGLYVWRIEKFNVVPWPKEEYGHFYLGDTYIVLNIKKKEKEEGLDYFAHMWVGKDSKKKRLNSSL
ncbi:MAG: hypothetical protein MJ252_15520 [archaeon]|nr:hypothetical protein [archaeon]